MTPDERLINQLRAQVETQEDTIKRLWVDRQKKLKRIAIQQHMIDKAATALSPTWKERVLQEANEVFMDG